MMEDVLLNEGNLDFVLVIGEYSDDFLDELPRLPLKREIDFCIDLVWI